MTDPLTPEAIAALDPETLGRIVRAEWVSWATEQLDPKPSWLVPWEGLSEPDREVDRRIGIAVARFTQCRAAGVAVFVKQLGSKPISEWPVAGLPIDAPHHAYGSEDDPWCEIKLRESHGRDMDEWPEDLRVREWPAGYTP